MTGVNLPDKEMNHVLQYYGTGHQDGYQQQPH